jgi:hypothetical protein
MPALSLAFFALSHLALVGALAVVAVVLGLRLGTWACPESFDRRWGLALALGLGALGCAGSLLAALGLFTRLSVLLLLAGSALAGGPAWRPFFTAVGSLASQPRRTWVLAALVAGLPCVLLALYPPTGFDALLYHFPAARLFAEEGRIRFAPELRYPAFPWLNEVLFSIAFQLQDDVTAQLLQCVAHLATAGLLWDLVRRRFGPAAGVLAACLWLGSPLAEWLAASAYVEPLLALFLLATVTALETAEEGEKRRWHLLAGGFAGFAAATKYLGLAVIAMAALWILFDSPRRMRARAVLVPLLVVLAIALPWYVWIAHATGDPLYPVLTKARRAPHGTVDLAALGERLRTIAILPWSLLFHRQAAGPYPPGSPLLRSLWLLPFLAWRRVPETHRLAAVGLALALAIAVMAPDARMLSIVGPLFSAGIAGVAARLLDARWGAAAAARVLLALAVIALLPAGLYSAYLMARRGPIPLEAEAREVYLRRQLPGYGALSWLNSQYGQNASRRYTVYGLWTENLRYYAAGGFLGDLYGPARFADTIALAGRNAELRDHLAALGAGHLLVRRLDDQPSVVQAKDSCCFRLEYQDAEAKVYALLPEKGGS